jgi:undecaprenyl diphosphate synthase
VLPDVARSVAIIMDGNGRWASRRRLPVAAGHRAGTRALRRTVEAAIDLGVESLCVYAFSTENWSRPPDEVDALMEIFVETIERELPDLAREGVRTRFIGRRDRATPALRAKVERLEEGTAANERLQLWIAFDYGGRDEIVEAARRLAEEGVDPQDIDENAIAARLYAPEMAEPDLLIRTSGELRISNFLLWQLAYTELVFVDTLWPDFGERELRQALAEYASRRRRFGGR